MDKKQVLDSLWSARWGILSKKNEYAYQKITEAINLIQSMDIEPERPDINPNPDNENKYKYQEPTIKDSGVYIKSRGHYKTPSGKAMGVLVHYTAGSEILDSNKDAINTLSYLGRNGLGCLVMDHDGVIYKPKGWDIFKDYSYHAGSSKWMGFEGMSLYTIGMEIVNPGKLIEWKGDYYAWYDLERDSKGRYIGVKDGKSPVQNPRYSPGKDNIKRGYYKPYTDEQEESLIDFCLKVLKECPESKVDYIFGHDECSASRKSDPGACLSMTMPEFRELLRSLI